MCFWRRPPVAAVLLALAPVVSMACAASDNGNHVREDAGALRVRVVAGPTGPETLDRGTGEADERPLEGASVVVFDAEGEEVGSAESDAEGRLVMELPPGRYELQPRPVSGMPWTPEPIEFVIEPSGEASLTVRYDTGIR